MLLLFCVALLARADWAAAAESYCPSDSCADCVVGVYEMNRFEAISTSDPRLRISATRAGVRPISRTASTIFRTDTDIHKAEAPAGDTEEWDLDIGTTAFPSRFVVYTNEITLNLAAAYRDVATQGATLDSLVPFRKRAFSQIQSCGNLGIFLTTYASVSEMLFGGVPSQNLTALGCTPASDCASLAPHLQNFISQYISVTDPDSRFVDYERRILAFISETPGSVPPTDAFESTEWEEVEMVFEDPQLASIDINRIHEEPFPTERPGFFWFGMSCHVADPASKEFSLSLLQRSIGLLEQKNGAPSSGDKRRQATFAPTYRFLRCDASAKGGSIAVSPCVEQVVEYNEDFAFADVSTECLVQISGNPANPDAYRVFVTYINGKGLATLTAAQEKTQLVSKVFEEGEFEGKNCRAMWTEGVETTSDADGIGSSEVQVFMLLEDSGGGQRVTVGTFTGPHTVKTDGSDVTYQFQSDADFDLGDTGSDGALVGATASCNRPDTLLIFALVTLGVVLFLVTGVVGIILVYRKKQLCFARKSGVTLVSSDNDDKEDADLSADGDTNAVAMQPVRRRERAQRKQRKRDDKEDAEFSADGDTNATAMRPGRRHERAQRKQRKRPRGKNAPQPLKRVKDIEVGRKIGAGSFGDVFFGKWQQTTEVALKMLKGGRHELHEFAKEAQTLQKLDHPRIVRFFGIFVQVPDDSSNSDSSSSESSVVDERVGFKLIRGSRYYMVTEFMGSGAVNVLLQTLAEAGEIDMRMATRMALDTAAGMRYLQSQGIIHRDLSARNLLAQKADDDYVVKVADFGLSRSEYYNASSTGSSIFPVKWSAPEVLEFERFSHKSDVFSFGVTMWELMTFGRVPWAGLTNSEALDCVLRGERLDPPKNILSGVWDIIEDAWAQKPENRPDFPECFVRLQRVYNTLSGDDDGRSVRSYGSLEKMPAQIRPRGDQSAAYEGSYEGNSPAGGTNSDPTYIRGSAASRRDKLHDEESAYGRRVPVPDSVLSTPGSVRKLARSSSQCDLSESSDEESSRSRFQQSTTLPMDISRRSGNSNMTRVVISASDDLGDEDNTYSKTPADISPLATPGNADGGYYVRAPTRGSSLNPTNGLPSQEHQLNNPPISRSADNFDVGGSDGSNRESRYGTKLRKKSRQ